MDVVFSDGRTGSGTYLRDHEGDFISVRIEYFPYYLLIVEADYSKVILESDSQIVALSVNPKLHFGIFG